MEQLQKNNDEKAKNGAVKTGVPFFAKTSLIQKKLSIGSSNDSYETEADHMADRVMSMSNPAKTNASHSEGLIQKKCAACEEEDKIQKKPLAETIQRASLNARETSVAPNHIEDGIKSSKGGGESMDDATQNFMENRFGNDFSNVRIHTGSQAIQMSRELNAQAFTVGNDIYFNQGKYNPDTHSGKHLLAHELTHTIQQGNQNIQRKVEFRDVGRGEASGFGRRNDIIQRLNDVSTGATYSLDASNDLQYALRPGGTLNNFDTQLTGFIDNARSIRLRLSNHHGLMGDRINGFNIPIDGDSFTTGYVDVDDLMGGTNLGFQMLFLHIVRERMSVNRYTERIGTWTEDQANREFPRAHTSGIDSEAQILREFFNDPSIRLVNDSPSATVRRVFRNCHRHLIRRRISNARNVNSSFIDIIDPLQTRAAFYFTDQPGHVGNTLQDYLAQFPTC